MTNQTVNSLYEDGLEAANAMGQITDSVGDSRAQIILSLQHAPDNKFSATHDHPVSLHTDAMVKDIESITVLMRDIRDRQLAQEGKTLADKFAKTSDLYIRDGIRPARAAVLDGDYTRANEILQVKVNPLYQAAHGDAEALLGQLLDSARAAHDLAGERYLLVRNVCFAGGLIGLMLIAWSGRLLIRAVVEPLNEAAAVANAVTSGDLTRQIEITSDDETGQLLKYIRYHRGNRQYCLSDQHPGVERRSGSRQGRRPGPRFCGDGGRSSRLGTAQCRGGEGNQGPHRRFGGQSRRGR